jgi:hypothetical protein
MTGNTHNPTPATEPLVLRLSERLGALVARLRGWSTAAPVEGEWYLVTDGRSVWPAISYKDGVGGWSNHDTWEDFDRRVIAWQRVMVPRALNVRTDLETTR